MRKLVTTLLLLLALSACAKDADWSRFGYDALQAWSHSVNPPNSSDMPDSALSYPQYQHERELLKRDNATN